MWVDLYGERGRERENEKRERNDGRERKTGREKQGRGEGRVDK